MKNKYFSRITSSARGEVYNPLTWPFLFSTLCYSVGFTFFAKFEATKASSLYQAMYDVSSFMPLVWGIVGLATIVLGMSFMLFNIPPIGKVSGLVGFTVWIYAAFCWALEGGYLLVGAVAIPNMWFWFWQYLSLSHFRREDAEDKATMQDYDAGGYDDELNPKDGKIDRDNNRGRDVQSSGSYDIPDYGTDASRTLDDSQ